MVEELSKDQIENEIQARVEFKMHEFLTAMKNIANANWHMAANTGKPKYAHYWEAFDQMYGLMMKEIRIPVPRDDMAEQKRRIKRNEAIDVIMEQFCRRGDRDYHRKERLLVSIIEKAQNW